MVYISWCVCVCVRPLGVVDVASSQDDPYSRCAAVQIVNSQSFFIRGSTNHKHRDVLRPETEPQVWIMSASPLCLWVSQVSATCLWGCWLPGKETGCPWVDLWSSGRACREAEADAECTRSPHPDNTTETPPSEPKKRIFKSAGEIMKAQ